MSANSTSNSNSGSSGDDGEERPSREVAWRLFAAEFDDADYQYAESDEERAPNYVVTPTGARVNRLFAVGVLTSVEQVNEDVVRARVVDPTGAFVVYAGQYQPDALASLENADVPSFVAVTGKARTFSPEDSEQVYTSIRPESVNAVTSETRDRWVVTAAERTLARVSTFADALDMPERGDELTDALVARDVPYGLASGISHAIDHYGTTPAYLAAVRELALDASRVVAGERDEVEALALAPNEGGGTDADLSYAGAELAEVETTGATTDERVEATPEGETATETTAPSPDDLGDGGEPAVQNAERADGDVDDEESALESGEDEQWEMDEETRNEVEEEFDVGFSTGNDIPEGGESDLATDEEPAAADEPAAGVAESASESGGASDLGDFDASTDFGEDGGDADDLDDFTASEYDEPESDAEDAEAAPPDVDLEDLVVDYMDDLDDGDGADRDDLVRTVLEETEADESEIADAIQSALMSGRCYESGEDHLKAI
ncbi:RPA family protein [Halarchaeum nitratireducens]|uniref:Glycerol dehydrogenase n=1 Tax=Halarchaeum nitratireducens TaxID=489913 RepID=A0A830GAZ3_9EURY|nr:hypothetical protein [Halarchaeum nitratireducens]GGN16421.1 hypothetical protein GCM10009021_16270 [Halarchaeum nitratireducens]